jgi:hypothetical protein
MENCHIRPNVFRLYCLLISCQNSIFSLGSYDTFVGYRIIVHH